MINTDVQKLQQNKKLTGKLFDIKGFSVHDGPGIRTTLFFKGCPLRCPWCHSPESQAFDTELNWMENKCVGIEKCGSCIEVCPNGAISPAAISPADKNSSNYTSNNNKQIKQLPTVDRSKCDNCGACAKACTACALFMCGTDYTIEEIMGRIMRDMPFFNRSGGGITISGGECLCQPEFTLEILKRCKKKSIHTAVDTSGFAKWEVIEPIVPYADLFLYDIKGIDAKLHEQTVGAQNAIILRNARKIAAAGGKLHIRIPVIPGYSDSEQVFEDIAEFVFELGKAVEIIQILPYHKLGTAKWERLQKDKPIFEASPPTDELIQERKKQLEIKGLNVIVY